MPASTVTAEREERKKKVQDNEGDKKAETR